jgi:hypothetical protein
MIIRDNYKKLTIKYPHSVKAQTRYRHYRNLVTKLIRDKKVKTYDRKFKETIHDSRKTWCHINSILFNKSRYTPNTPIILRLNGQTIISNTEISDTFNHYFITAPINIKNSITIDPTIANALTNMENYDIIFPFNNNPSDAAEISEILTRMKGSNCRDIYGLSNNILKIHKNNLALPLSQIINSHISNGLFPSHLKTAIVKPIFKTGDRREISNYRPIASLPILSKVFEYVIHNRFVEFFKRNKIINDYQFGFIPK